MRVAAKLPSSAACLVALLAAACGTVSPPPAERRAVTIQRDDWGVPHIFAATEELGLYGLGYAEAEDQLEKLLGAVYWYRGRMAELEGKARLALDIEQRRWRHAETAEEGFGRLDPELQRGYRAFVAGVRRYMAEHPDRTPAWAPELTASDLVGINRAVFSTYVLVEGPKECRAAGVHLDDGLEELVGGIFPGASNGWALAPARTADGATMLLADPHTELQNPSYYEFRMHAGGLHSSGFAAGPLLWQVHTRSVAWAMTTGNPDMWDCYEVEVDPADPRRYLYDGRWREMDVRQEVFHVRDGEAVTKTFEYTTHNGVLSPVVARQGDRAYVVSWSQMNDSGLIDEEIYRMNHARTVAELLRAMELRGMFPQNLVLGDSSGHISYVRAGKTPIRPPGYDFTRPVPGNTSATAWRGFYPFRQEIQVHDPPQGYIQNDNVAPDRLFADGNLRATDYPRELFNDTPGRITSRGLRTIEVLSKAEGFTVEDARKLAFDEKWVTTASWRKALQTVAERYPELLASRLPATRAFVRRLMDFDGFASADSVAALDFYYWRQGMWALFSRPELEPLRRLPWSDDMISEEFATALLDRAEAARAEMVDELGTPDVPLGEVFRVGRGQRSWPLGGESINLTEVPDCLADINPMCERTIRAFASGPLDARKQRRAFRGNHSMRLVVFTDPIQSYSLHVYGQSDSPDSPHFDDQARLLSERRLKPTYFERGELEGHVESTRILDLPAAE